MAHQGRRKGLGKTDGICDDLPTWIGIPKYFENFAPQFPEKRIRGGTKHQPLIISASLSVGTRPIRRLDAVPTKETHLWKSIVKTTGLIGLVCSLVFCSSSLVAFRVFLASAFPDYPSSEQKCNRHDWWSVITYGSAKSAIRTTN